MNILKVAAPLVMGYLGKQSKQQSVSDSNEIGDLLLGCQLHQANKAW